MRARRYMYKYTLAGDHVFRFCTARDTMSNASGLQPTGSAPDGARRRTNTVVLANEERFNVQTFQRKILLCRLETATAGQRVPAAFWALAQVCDIQRLEWMVHLANLSLEFSRTFSDISCGFPFRWVFKPPHHQKSFSTVTSGTFSSRRSGFPPVARWSAKERDGFQCVITGARKGYEAAPIFPRVPGISRLNDESWIPDFWSYVDVFWGEATAERWRKAVFNDPANPNTPVNDCSNLICLQRDLRAAWLDGYFALRPVWLATNKTEMEIEFYWQPQYTHRVFDMIDTTKEPMSSKNLSSVKGMVVMVGEGDRTDPASRPIESGYRFKMRTDNPDTHPLPSYDLLDIQWHLTRIVAMSSAAHFTEDDYYSEDSAQGDTRMAVASPSPPASRPLPPLPHTPSFPMNDTFKRTFSPDRAPESIREEWEQLIEEIDDNRRMMIGPLPESENDQSSSVSRSSEDPASPVGSVGTEYMDDAADEPSSTGDSKVDI
jgi:hypothetical protein